MTNKENLFRSEAEILANYKELIAKEEIGPDEYKIHLKEFCDNYAELLDQTKLITKVSDKLQNKLNSAYETLELKNIELQNTIDELTKARVGRKAQTIILFIGLTLFILEEIILEPFIDSILNNVWFSLSIKLIIAILLKPLETFVEKGLLKTAMRNGPGTSVKVPSVPVA